MSEPLTGELVGVLTQAYLKRLLESDDLFDNITVVSDDQGDVQSQMNKALATYDTKGGARGICVLVQLPSAGDKDSGVQFGPNTLRFSFLVLENRLMNQDTTKGGTGKRALTVARRINRILKNHGAHGLVSCFTADGNPNIVPTNRQLEVNGMMVPLIAYEVRHKADEADDTVYTKVATPVISGSSIVTTSGSPVGTAGDTITLTCGTAGADIYYTTDLTHPDSGNPSATLYATPFPSAAGTLMVRAHKAGSVGSNMQSAKFN